MRSTAGDIPFPEPPFSGKMPRRPTNAEVRTREYLTEHEVDALRAVCPLEGTRELFTEIMGEYKARPAYCG